uniref:Uncharacterized protein n=1 Tax=Anopheles funestus TaxID=62324 RepID=A0A182S3T0_ANOFN
MRGLRSDRARCWYPAIVNCSPFDLLTVEPSQLWLCTPA